MPTDPETSMAEATAADAHGWRTMETAPRDGTLFLALFLGEPIICKWGHRFVPEDSEWLGVGVKWYDGRQYVTSLTDGLGHGPGPSHWHPLPPPPTEE